jgi:hypothetical protein
MISIMWFVIRSAHAVINGASTSPCGRIVHGQVTDDRPAGRTCETCLRAVSKALGE